MNHKKIKARKSKGKKTSPQQSRRFKKNRKDDKAEKKQDADVCDKLPPLEFPLSNKLVVLVEDTDIIQLLVSTVIKREGHNVVCFVRTQDALDFIRRSTKKPDLVITDNFLPDMTGLRAVDILGKEFPDIPVILMSGIGFTWDMWTENKTNNIYGVKIEEDHPVKIHETTPILPPSDYIVSRPHNMVAFIEKSCITKPYFKEVVRKSLALSNPVQKTTMT